MDQVFTYDDFRGLTKDGLPIYEASYLYTMLHGVPDAYAPRENAVAMAVGISDRNMEGSIIRDFHRLRYDIQDTRVVGCDTRLRTPTSISHVALQVEKVSETRIPLLVGGGSQSDYEFEARGPIGNAALIDPWLHGLGKLDADAFDFVHLNNPDYASFREVRSILKRALQFLTPKGIVTVISTGIDRQYLYKMIQKLSKDRKIRVFPIKDFIWKPSRYSYYYSLAAIQKS